MTRKQVLAAIGNSKQLLEAASNYLDEMPENERANESVLKAGFGLLHSVRSVAKNMTEIDNFLDSHLEEIINEKEQNFKSQGS